MNNKKDTVSKRMFYVLRFYADPDYDQLENWFTAMSQEIKIVNPKSPEEEFTEWKKNFANKYQVYAIDHFLHDLNEGLKIIAEEFPDVKKYIQE